MEDARRVEEGFGHAPLEKKDHNKAYFSEKLDGTDSGDRIENEKDDRRAVFNQPTEKTWKNNRWLGQKARGLQPWTHSEALPQWLDYTHTHTYNRTTFLTTVNMICYDSFLIKVAGSNAPIPRSC